MRQNIIHTEIGAILRSPLCRYRNLPYILPYTLQGRSRAGCSARRCRAAREGGPRGAQGGREPRGSEGDRRGAREAAARSALSQHAPPHPHRPTQRIRAPEVR